MNRDGKIHDPCAYSMPCTLQDIQRGLKIPKRKADSKPSTWTFMVDDHDDKV